MSAEERKKFAEIVKALDDTEKALAIRLFPSELLWSELKRRDQIEKDTIRKVKEALKVEEEQ